MKKFSCVLVMMMMLVLALPGWAQSVIRRPLQNRGTQPPVAQPQIADHTPRAMNPNEKWNEPGQVINQTVRYDVMAAPMFKFSQMNETFAFLAGGKLGWIINSQYLVGVEGYWLVNDVPGPEIGGILQPDLALKYGGLSLEYLIMPQNTVHFSVATLAGMGSVAYDYSSVKDDDTYWVVEPSVNVYVNMTEYLKLGLGVGYRYISDTDLGGLKGDDLRGVAATLSINFGSFGKTLIP